jgi:hypothetical protein
MVKYSDEDGWSLPQRKPITKEVLDRAIRAEEEAASREHQAQKAWFDRGHGAVMLKLQQLESLHASEDGVYLILEDLDLHITVDGLVTRIIEESPLAIKRSSARFAGLATSAAKAESSARNGRLGGRPITKGKARRVAS